MGFDSQKSFIMAERLKQLREERGLSHDKLSKALFDKYGVKISSDSLINYEVAFAEHTKAYKNQGMRVEYLRCLSDFYGVSSDYILGETKIRSMNPDISAAVKMTGLSEDTIKTLSNNCSWGLNDESGIIDILVFDSKYRNYGESRSYRSILNLLKFFFSYSSKSGMRKQVFSDGTIVDKEKNDKFISSDAISLDDTIIENAVLAEIQHALINLKKNHKNGNG